MTTMRVPLAGWFWRKLGIAKGASQRDLQLDDRAILTDISEGGTGPLDCVSKRDLDASRVCLNAEERLEDSPRREKRV